MIYKDKDGFPTDRNGDGGDSAMRAGMLMICGESVPYYKYEIKPGFLVRHPNQYTWNNSANFSRDQLICFIAGLWRMKIGYSIRKNVFWAHAKRFFFAQNFERDKPGSKKYLWPHYFFKDSSPNSTTWLKKFNWRTFKFERQYDELFYEAYCDVFGAFNGSGSDHEFEERIVDFADPLLPNHIGVLIIAGRIWQFYPFLLVCYPWHLLKLYFRSRSNPKGEENQMIAECSVYGTLGLYRQLIPDWAKVSKKYWSDRGEVEYHERLEALIGE